MNAVDGGVREEQWHRVHPITLLLRIWHVIAALVAFVTYQHSQEIRHFAQSDFIRALDLWSLLSYISGGLVLLVLATATVAYLSWKNTTYAVNDQAVWMRSGILLRNQRHARLERIQSMDISQPLLGRLFGLGQLNVEVAGGKDSNFLIGYLKLSQLEDLRAEILARAAGIYSDQYEVSLASPEDEAQRPLEHRPPRAVPPIPVAEETPLYEVSVGRLLVGNLLSMGTVLSLLVLLGGCVGAVVLFFVWGFESLVSMSGLLAIFAAVGSFIWSRFAGDFHFRAAISADGIRVRRGLTSTSAQTIPPRRVHAVTISQPFFWRFFGWYRVEILQAGTAHSGGQSEENSQKYGSHFLLPVGTQREAELALWMVIADLGVDDPRAFLDSAFHGTREGGGFIPIPERAKIFDPFSYRRRAYALTRTAFVTRDGWLTRRVSIAPVTRLQSVAIESGPWERGRRLCSVHMHTVDGPVALTAQHVDDARAQEVLRDLLIIGERQRVSEPPERWMRRVLDIRED